MKLLNKGQYYLASNPLNEVPFNHMFANDVARQKINGIIYADSFDHPTSFYILHPYGMSLLIGNTENKEFNLCLSDYLLTKNYPRKGIEWLQVYPEGWNSRLKQFLGDKLLTRQEKENGVACGAEPIRAEEFTRVNFIFNADKYQEFRAGYPEQHFEIYRSGEEEFLNMPGTVVPKFFWNNSAQFLDQGIGFSLRLNGELACTAFSAYVDEGCLEFGIESVPQFRGMGFARGTCSALIDYCLGNRLEPVWACRLENTGSYLLAQELGFEPIRFLPFYKVDL